MLPKRVQERPSLKSITPSSLVGGMFAVRSLSGKRLAHWTKHCKIELLMY